MRNPTKKAGPGRGFLVAAWTGAVLALFIAQACSNKPEVAEGISLQTAPAELRPMRITAEADGELEPVLKVEVKSKASGEILKLFVDSGDEVKAGTILAKVDPRDVQNGYDQAKADLDVAEAREKNARAQLDRNRALLAEEVITKQAFEATELDFANALAGLVRAQTNEELAELQLTDVTIMAPMAGTILEKLVEYGQVIQSATQNVSGGTTLFIMANLDDMRVRMLVDEVDVGKLSAGLPATVSVEAFQDRTFHGHIEKIEPQALVQQNVTMFPVIGRLDNRAGLLKPGMNAAVEVLVNERTETIAVPNNAIVQPQEVAPAAEVLGLDPESMSIDFAAWGPLMAQAATRFAELEGGGAQPTRMGAAGSPGASGDAGRGGVAGGGSTGERAYRPAVAFVVDTAGNITPRPVVMGLSDWDYVEILAGLEAGEELALIGAAQLQARQQERIERMRQRMRPF